MRTKFITCIRNLTSQMKKGASASHNSTSTAGGASNSTEDPLSEGTGPAQDTQKEEFKLRRTLVTDNKKLSTTDILNAVPYYEVFANVRMLSCRHALEQFHYIRS